MLQAIAKLGWEKPTLVQEKAIPLLLEGKDVLMRARTGSGKTAAFLVPVVQRVLNGKRASTEQETVVLVLSPSRELCGQTTRVLRSLTDGCAREVRCVDVSGQGELAAQRPLLLERPDVVVGTPGRVLQHIRAGHLQLRYSLRMLVLDEADLVLSFGHEPELRELLTHLPSICQAVLASATLGEQVLALKQLVLHNPVTLRLQEPEMAPAEQLSHYHLAAEEGDKATILCALLKLHLVRGKTIIFVSSVDRCYKLKLFLEQFGVPVCVLNSELPSTARCHAVHQFNQGMYDVIVASDERCLERPEETARPAPSKRRKDDESGVSRGIDFQCVANVINFDFPVDEQSYVHRAGRTARGNNAGSVLSLVSTRERPVLERVEVGLGEERAITPYQFRIEEVEPFRYRARDAWRAATRVAVREARLKEIKQEMFNCQKLKSYFEDNPTDLAALRHDKPLRTVKRQAHLADVPDYMVPAALKNIAGVSTRRAGPPGRRRTPRLPHTAAARHKRKMNDPLAALQLKTFRRTKR